MRSNTKREGGIGLVKMAVVSKSRYKRPLDILLASIGLLFFSPVMVFICLLLFLCNGMPVFFCQSRLGREKRSFRILKLRTMESGCVTKMGGWLRATGLDELPQFINILIGDMSIVGPRPLTHYDVVRLKWDGTEYEARWSLRPGITGLAQLFSKPGAKSSWRLDKFYIRNRSAWLDIRIIFLSLLVNIFGKRCMRRMIRRR